MMDWTKQAEEMAKTWTETQKKMWDNWFNTVQNFEKNQVFEAWKKTVETWEESVKNMLDAQTAWTQMWADNLTSAGGASKEMVEWSRQLQEMARRWSETQKQLWASWFDMVKKFDPAKMTGGWDTEGQKMFQGWQEAMQKVVDTQTEWARHWTTEQAGEKAGDKK
jgi:hypothetical protein